MTKPLTASELEAMTWSQLAELAKKRGQPYSFPKAELVNRLSGVDGSNASHRSRRRRRSGPRTPADYSQLFKQFNTMSQRGTVTVAFDDTENPTEAVALITLK